MQALPTKEEAQPNNEDKEKLLTRPRRDVAHNWSQQSRRRTLPRSCRSRDPPAGSRLPHADSPSSLCSC